MSEYVILITIVVAFMMTMFTYIKRGTQGLIKHTADQIGSQLKSEQDFSGRGGYMNHSDTTISAYANHDTNIWSAGYQKIIKEGTHTQTQTTSNLGFSEQ